MKLKMPLTVLSAVTLVYCLPSVLSTRLMSLNIDGSSILLVESTDLSRTEADWCFVQPVI